MKHCDIFISVAAVADYRPRVFSSDKIKKEGQFLNGVTEQTNGDLVVEIEDSLEGNETKITI